MSGAGQILRYTLLLMRAYLRDRTALFFGFFFPLLFMGLFGVLNLGAFGHVSVGIVDEAKNADSGSFQGVLGRIETLQLSAGGLDDELAALRKGERDMVLVIPADFHVAPASASAAVPTVTLYLNHARPEQSGVGAAIVTQAVDQMSFAVSQTRPIVAIERRQVEGRDLTYVDFLTPGIIGMTIMQLGVSSVMFAFVVDRQRGVIRRIMATPISRRSYMASHVLQRLIIAMLQVLILIAVAALAFKVQIVGGLGAIFLLTLAGSVLFLCLGFAVTGFVATENAAPAVMQLVTLPQMFLSGVFFSREAVPAFLRPISDVLPLTFLNDALRQVAIAGASLADVGGDLLGIALWSVVLFVIAFRFFKLDA